MKKKNHKLLSKTPDDRTAALNPPNLLNIKNSILLCVIPLTCFLVLRALGVTAEADVHIVMRFALYAAAIYGAYLAYQRRLNVSQVVFFLIIAGIIMRFGYTLYTDACTRYHDIGAIEMDSTGHYAYMANLVFGRLPQSNHFQFYHPPLFYAVSALMVRVAMLFSGKTEVSDFMYMSQLVSCLASCITLITMKKIMDELKIDEKLQAAAIAVTAFYPAQIYAAGRLNNDALAAMFMVLALYYTLKWHKSIHVKHIIGIAVTIGCGMMTKLNCGIVAFITGPLMIYHFIAAIKSKDTAKIKNIIMQLFVFAIICFPLGLWYPIRNYIKFDQPLTYVCPISKDAEIYRGATPFADRWLKIGLTKFKSQPFLHVNEETSIVTSLIKTGVHGEFNWDNMSKLLAWSIDFIHAALMLLSAIAIAVVMLVDKKTSKLQKFSAFWAWAVMAISYISFNISYPFMCTADFRYVFMGQIAAAIFIAYWLGYCKELKYKSPYIISMIVIALFCTASIMHIC